MPEVLTALQRDVAELEAVKTSHGIAVLRLAAKAAEAFPARRRHG
jgi:hypothetical protein